MLPNHKEYQNETHGTIKTMESGAVMPNNNKVNDNKVNTTTIIIPLSQ